MVALAVVGAADTAAQRVRLGQRFRVLGVQYEIVQFTALGFADGAAYEVRIPAETANEYLPAGIQLYRIGGQSSVGVEICEPTTGTVAGVPARVSVWSYVGMQQAFQPAATGEESLSARVSLSAAIRLDAATCLHVGPWMWSDTVSEVDDAAGRGVHDLALDHQPSAADLDRDAAALESLFSYVAIRRLN